MRELLQQVLTKSILNKRNYSGLGYPDIVDKVCEKNNLVFEMDPDTNGWEVDWWGEIKTESGDPYCKISGSMYYGTLKVKFDI